MSDTNGVMAWTTTHHVLGEVHGERTKQDLKWGEQNHEQSHSASMRREYGIRAQSWKDVNALLVKQGQLTWDGVLLEEVYEALAEADPAKQREEVLQVAAVAVAMIECIDRNA
jgi:hypothetical protein